jgi:hypothetical protein
MFGNLTQVSRIFGKVLWSGCFGNVTQVSRTYIYYPSFVLGNPNQSFRIQRAESNPVRLLFNLLVSFVFFLVLVNHHHHRQDHLARDNVARGKQSRPGKSNPRKKKGKIWKTLGILSSFLLFNYFFFF